MRTSSRALLLETRGVYSEYSDNSLTNHTPYVKIRSDKYIFEGHLHMFEKIKKRKERKQKEAAAAMLERQKQEISAARAVAREIVRTEYSYLLDTRKNFRGHLPFSCPDQVFLSFERCTGRYHPSDSAYSVYVMAHPDMRDGIIGYSTSDYSSGGHKYSYGGSLYALMLAVESELEKSHPTLRLRVVHPTSERTYDWCDEEDYTDEEKGIILVDFFGSR